MSCFIKEDYYSYPVISDYCCMYCCFPDSQYNPLYKNKNMSLLFFIILIFTQYFNKDITGTEVFANTRSITSG